MSFQTDDLTILALGILNDAPVDPDQPALVNGIHCRWAFPQEKGFPLHGFYLFRREHRPRGRVCLSPFFEGLRPGTKRERGVDTPLGRLDSDHVLVLTDDFAPGGTVEADGREGLRFSLPAGVEAGSVEVRIGFRDPGLRLVRTCIDFRRFKLGTGPSPRIEKGVVFDVEPPPVSPWVPATSIEEWSGAPRGLVVSRRSAVDLPCAARKVDLLLTNRAALRIEALDANGTVLATRDLQKGELTAGLVTLNGEAITQVVFQTPATEGGLLHEICFECPTSGDVESEIEVRALAGTKVVASKTVRGSTGQIVSETLAGDAITVIEISPGPAALVDLCYIPTKQGVTFGWGEVPGFQYPLCLPVAHEDYRCPGKPATFEEAQSLAFSRVTYRAPEGWDQGFLALHGQLEILVKGGPGGGPMAGRVNPDLIGEPLGPAPGLERLKLPKQRPLDLVLLASLQPAMAQMLGLYFTDSSAETEVPYDYLLLADSTGVLGGSAATALEWLAFQPDFKAVDAYLAAGKSIPSKPAPPVPPPGPARAYALPGAMMRNQVGDLVDAQTNVGLWWDPPPPKPVGVGTEEPNVPVLYYLWRAYLGLNRPPESFPPDAAEYKPLLWPADPKRPDQPPRLVTVVLAKPVKPPVPPASGEVRGSPEWPPPPISFHFIDSGLPEGWYSYRIVGQDIFGRHSALGSPAEWYQWDPPPQTPPLPLPWYYEKGSPGHHSIHPFAVALLDKIPPPHPTGIEATCLDPLDRWVLQDESYAKWRDDHKDVVGLRVSWRWTLAHMNQAPDTREFRIYYVPGRLNELPGGIGLDDLQRSTAWPKRLASVPYADAVEETLEPSRDPQNRSLDDEVLKKAGATVTQATVTGRTALLPPGVDLAGVQPWLDHLYLDDDTARASKTYRVEGVDPKFRTLDLDGEPDLGGNASPWTIGRPVRLYEVFLPAPDVGENEPFQPTLNHPTVFAQIGVSAADDKTHTEDDPKWGAAPLGDRFGNEGPVGGPAAIYRVLQKPPDPPELPDYPDKLWATPADYHSRSFFTFRWKVPEAGLKVHVLRALDDSLFQRDLLIRETREGLDPVLLPEAPTAKTEHLDFFPADWNQADTARRQKAATEVNEITSEADYVDLSDDAWMVLALLPGNEGIGSGIGLEVPAKQRLQSALSERDWAVRSARKDFLAAAPASFSSRRLAAYDELSDPTLRILAGLPGNEDAFAQITLKPLDPTDPATFDRRGPDDLAEHAENASVRAYLDTLPGRATNRYFYRAVCVDGAHNRSGLSLSTPPVYLPKVEPPRAPVITGVIGGDREITIRWASNREPDLAEYRVYRVEEHESAADIRRMNLLHTEPAPRDRSAELAWTDRGVRSYTAYLYTILAVDASGNASPASRSFMAQAYDYGPPEEPTWERKEWILIDSHGREHLWSSKTEGLQPASLLTFVTFQRKISALPQREVNGRWQAAAAWIRSPEFDSEAGVWRFKIIDTTAEPGSGHRYRAKLRTLAGRELLSEAVFLPPAS